MTPAPAVTQQIEVFRISPLIRYTLYGLFLALILPLPFLMLNQQQTDFLPLGLVGFGVGWVALSGLLSQHVRLDSNGITVAYASWVPGVLVRGWSLPWAEIKGIHSRPTSQGGQAHYLLGVNGAYLLPMRVAGFAQLLRSLEAYTQLNTQKIKPLAQPWMYLMLAICVVLMLGFDIPIILMALQSFKA